MLNSLSNGLCQNPFTLCSRLLRLLKRWPGINASSAKLGSYGSLGREDDPRRSTPDLACHPEGGCGKLARAEATSRNLHKKSYVK
jgi:hypothetical protein